MNSMLLILPRSIRAMIKRAPALRTSRARCSTRAVGVA